MQTEIVNVTPQMASDWLSRNTGNRALRRTTVDGLKAAFGRGEYVMTHQGIAFSEDGTLLDGQHRLSAISEMRDGTYPMLVTRGLSEKSFEAMDIGVKRTAADALRAEDRRLVEAAKLVASMCAANRSSVTPTMLIPIIHNIERNHNALIAFCPTVSKVWSSAPVRVAAVMSIKAGQDVDYVRTVYHALVMGKFPAMPPAAQAIYKANVEGRVRANDRADMIARCLVVFDQTRSSTTRVQVKDPNLAVQAVRQMFEWLLESDPVGAPKKKAAPKGAAKGVLRSEYRIEGA